MDERKSKRVFDALETFRIELPSWGFANIGARFGKFIQPAAATTTGEKFSDAGQVHLQASLVDHEELSQAQTNCDLIGSESTLQDAFNTDVRPVVQEWRYSKGLPRDPLKAFLEGGYIERITKERAARNSQSITSYA